MLYELQISFFRMDSNVACAKENSYMEATPQRCNLLLLKVGC